MKKIFTLIAAMLLVPWVGWGQETITINTAEELREFAEKVNNNTDEEASWDVVLGADIDLGGESNPWTPIEEFRGTFEGKNHIIRDVYINTPGTEGGYGFFIAVLGDVKNLNIEGNIVATGSTTYYGGICAGVGEDSYLSNCSFSGEINIEIDSYDQAPGIGGICGSFSTMISNCVNRADINVKINNLDMPWGPNPNVIRMFGIGGVAGQGASMVENCYNVGNLKIEGDDNAIPYLAIGGIAGIAGINNCYNIGSIDASIKNEEFIESNLRGSTSIGGLIGIFMLDIKNSYNIGKITALTETIAKDYYKGNIYGWNMFQEDNISNVYYLSQGIEAEDETILSATQEQFSSGEIAYELRKAGAKYGQLQNNPNNDATPVLLAFEENKGKEVYKRTLDYSKYEGNATEATELEDYVNSGNLWLPELNENEGWYDTEGNLYTNESTLSPDIFEITLYAEAQTPHTITISEMEGGKVEANKTTAIKGETITLTVTPNEGYNYIDKSLTVKAGEETITVTPGENGTYTFIMPDANVTVSATFAEKLYTVTIEDCVGGTATIDGESHEFAAGATVALSIKADEGYKFSHIVYTYDGGSQKSEQTTFTMPVSNVTVEVFFVAGDDEEGDGAGTTLKRYRLYLADQDFYLNDEYDEAGLVLYSRHDKKYTDVGGSFTVWFEKNGEVNEGARVFISNRANGEYKEVKLDEVSGYYQIRNVQSNIYVKLYTEEGFPVANESIEATDARAYAQANKIVVITPEPTDVQIISMAGAVVASAQVAGQQEFANLAEGVYIVRMGKEIIKLQVRN